MRVPGRRLLALAVLAAVSAAPGCTYLRNRGRDAAQMFDLGVTFSSKPQFGLYVNCPVLVPIGYGHVDGTYAGIGGGKVGVMDHKQRNAGFLLWGYEKNSWQGSGENAPKAAEDQPVGLLAIARGERGEQPYRTSCKHYFHLGWVGVTFNICWVAIADFPLGWVGLHIPGGGTETAPAEPPKPKEPSEAGRGA